ncbi:hypothetical protein QA596_12595 [Balneolales bacterium ANBcel1]|nr:hypothetical protein [Balneolales bacterium ANBcel1]
MTDFTTSIKKVTHYDSSSISIQLSIIQSDSIQFDEFAINMYPVQEYFYSSVFYKINFQFIQSAYACSPIDPVSDDKILDIQIYSDKDFSDEYPAGENLAELFEVYALYMREGPGRINLIDYIAEEPNVPDQLILLLQSSPSKTSDIQFSVRYLQDGEKLNEFEFTTEPVTIIPKMIGQ